MKTAVVYARYSCDRQNEQSIDGQLRVCRDYANKNDIYIIDTYIDKAMSGTNDDRESFQRMLKDSDKQAWDYVLVYKLDRFSRNKYEMAIHRKHLKDNNVKLVSVMENIPEGPEGILLESLLEGMNQYYSEELSQKTKRGMNETRIKGNFIGGYPNYGYERDGAKLKINPDEAEILKQIFNDYANGKKVCDIARELNNKGLKNKGNEFYSTTIYNFLRQEKYTGIYTINGEQFDKIYPPIIDKDIFAICKKRIDANKHGRHTKLEPYLLKGKVFCGYCGSAMKSNSFKSTNKRLRYYKCSAYRKNIDCSNSKAIQKEVLENIVNKAILNLLPTAENVNILIDKIVQIHESRISKSSTLNVLVSDLSDVNKAIKNILLAIEKGILTNSTKSRLEELENKKKELEENIAKAKSKGRTHITQKDISNYFKYSLKQCPETMINLLVNKVTVYTDKIEISLNYTKVDDLKDTPQTILLFNEKITTTRRTRGNGKYTETQKYKVYLQV